MRPLKFILFLLAFTACKSHKDSDIPKNVSVSIGIYPSFHLPVLLKIIKENDSGYLTCKVLGNDTINKIVSYDSVTLTKKDFDIFFKTLDTVSLLKIPYDTSDIGMDGITIQAIITQDGKINKFSTWSPSRKEKPMHYKFLDAVFDLANNKLPKEENYIENVQDYLSYGIGVKIKSENPIIVKMYGSYSIDDATKLQLFFDSLPRDKPIIMDMSNFGGMGTILSNYFGVCDMSHEKMIWVTPGDLKGYFMRVGIDTNKMVPSIDSAKRMIKQQ